MKHNRSSCAGTYAPLCPQIGNYQSRCIVPAVPEYGPGHGQARRARSVNNDPKARRSYNATPSLYFGGIGSREVVYEKFKIFMVLTRTYI